MDRCIGKINNDNSVIIYNVEQRTSNSNNSGVLQSTFSSLILEHIKNKIAIAATDVAMEGEYLATAWIISTKGNEDECTDSIESTEWNEGIIPAGEGIGLLELIKIIVKNTAQLIDGKITIYNDNKKLLREIEKRCEKRVIAYKKLAL